MRPEEPADPPRSAPAAGAEAPPSEEGSEIVRLYRGLLFRDPDPAERAAGEAGSLVDAALRIVASAEYRAVAENARFRVLIDLCRAQLGLGPAAQTAAVANERLPLSVVAGEIVDLLANSGRSERAGGLPPPATDEDTTKLYRELLGREPESDAAVAQWRGGPIVDVALSFARSPEYLRRARRAADDDVIEFYREFLGREPHSEAEIALWRGRPLLDVALGFLRSSEFIEQTRLATEKDVARLYNALLRRGLREQGEVIWRGRPLVEVAINIAKSEEATRRQAAPHFLQPENVRRLHRIFLPDWPASDDWYREFVRIIRAHRIGVPEVVEYFHAMQRHHTGTAVEDAAVGRSVRASRRRWTSRFAADVTLVVPTINSATWLEHVIEFYAGLGLEVLFAVDARTSDATRAVLDAGNARHVEVSGEHARVESLIPDILAKVDTRWILRIDDDELPTPALLNFVCGAVDQSSEFVWEFPVANLRYEPGKRELQYSQFLSFYAFADGARLHRQARLFSRDGIKVEDVLHSSGYAAADARTAPSEALIFHFNWVLRSRSERAEKLRSYEAQDLVRARAAAHYSQFEEVPESWHMFAALPDERYRDFAQLLYRSRERRRPAVPAAAVEPVAAAASRPVFKGFWHGPPLDRIRRACLQSFLDRGQVYELYTYEPVAVPAGVRIRDAAAIMPKEELFYFGGADVAPFSDVFRAKLLLDTGGWWCDIDTICLSDTVPNYRYAWSRESPLLRADVSNGLIAGPKSDPIFRELYARCRKEAPVIDRRPQLGSEMFTELLDDLGLPSDMSGEAHDFCPLSSIEILKMWFPDFTQELIDKVSGALFLPLYLSMPKVSGIDLEILPPRGSYMDKILEEHNADRADARRYESEEVKSLIRSFVTQSKWALDDFMAHSGEQMLEFLGVR